MSSCQLVSRTGILLSIDSPSSQHPFKMPISSLFSSVRFQNVSLTPNLRSLSVPTLSQQMLDCDVSESSDHLYGSTVHNINVAGALYLAVSGAVLVIPESEGLATIRDCEFYGCEGANGGSVGLVRQLLTISGTSFSGSRATQKGGGMTLAHCTGTIVDCSFENNEAATANGGNDIFFEGSGSPSGLTFVSSSSLSNSPKGGFENAGVCTAWTELDALLPSSQAITSDGSVFLALEGQHENLSPVSSISDAIDEAGGLKLIRVMEGTFTAAELNLNQNVEMVGKGLGTDLTHQSILEVGVLLTSTVEASFGSFQLKPATTSSSIFSVSDSGAELKLDSVTISDLDSHSSPLFSLSGGTTTMTSSKVGSISAQSASIFAVSGSASLTLVSSVIRDITSSAPTIALTDTSSLTLTETLFVRVCRTAGNGAAVLESASGSLSGSAIFRFCRSDAGDVSVVKMTKGDSTSIAGNFLLQFNSGRDLSATQDVQLEGFTEEEETTILSSFVSKTTFTLQTSEASFSTQVDSTHVMSYEDADFALVADVFSAGMASLSVTFSGLSPTDLSPNQFSCSPSSEMTLKGTSTTMPTIIHSPHVGGPLFMGTEHSNIFLQLIRLKMLHSQKHPMIALAGSADDTSNLSLDLVVVTSDGQLCCGSFLHSTTEFNLAGVSFFDIHTTADSLITLNSAYDDNSYLTYSYSIETIPCSFTNISCSGDGMIHFDGVFLDASGLRATDCSAGNGGVLWINSRNLILPDSMFIRCSAQNGGALFIKSVETLECQQMYIDHCSAEMCGGGMFLTLDTFIDLASITFKQCHAGDGGGLFVDMSGDARLKYSYFTVLYDEDYTAYISFLFEGCTASNGGGQLSVNGSSSDPLCLKMTDEDQVFLPFFGGQLNSKGSDIFVHQSLVDSVGLENIVDSIKTSAWSSGVSSRDARTFCHVAIETGPNKIERFNMFPVLRTTGSGSSTKGCFLQQMGCQTLLQFSENFRPIDDKGQAVTTSILAYPALECKMRVTLSRQHFVVTAPEMEGLNPSDTRCYFNGAAEEDPSFCAFTLLEEATLELYDMSSEFFRHQIAHLVESTSLFLLDGLTITFRDDFESTLVLFEVSAGTLIMKDVHFLSLDWKGIFQHLNAPLIKLDQSPSLSNSEKKCSLHLSGCSFKDMHTAVGCSLIEMNMTSLCMIQYPSIENCVDVDDNPMRIIDVAGESLWKVITRQTWTEFPEASSSESGMFWSSDANPLFPELASHTLLVYLTLYKHYSIFTNAKNVDVAFCGNASFPCRTIEESVDHLTVDPQTTISVSESGLLSGIATFGTGGCLVLGQSDSGIPISVTEDARIVHSAQVGGTTLKLSSLNFNLPTTLSHSSLILGVSGTTSLEKCSFTSSVSIGFSLIEVTGGSVSLQSITFSSLQFSTTPCVLSSFSSASFSNVRLSNCVISEFVSATGDVSLPSVTVSACSFVGQTESPSNSKDVTCSWETGLVSLMNCTTFVEASHFTHLPQGAIIMKGGQLTLDDVVFSLNGVWTSDFASMRQNVQCNEGGTVVIDKEETEEMASQWISAPDCTVRGVGAKASMFVPTLLEKDSSSKQNKDKKSYSVSISGKLLIPCGLGLHVISVSEKKGVVVMKGETDLSLNAMTIPDWTETNMKFSLLLSEVDLDQTWEWRAMLSFGENERTPNYFVLKPSKEAIAKALGAQTLKWLIPLLVSLCVVALVIILAVFLILRRRKQKQTNGKDEEMQPELAEDKVAVEVEVEQPSEAIVAKPETNMTQANHQISLPTDNIQSQKLESRAHTVVEALKCGEKCEIEAVWKMDTLFNRLHGTERKNVDSVVVRRQLLKGLTHLVKEKPNSVALVSLNPHSIVLDGNDNVFIQLTPESNNQSLGETGSHTATTGQGLSDSAAKGTTKGHEGQRWEAPEVAESREKKREINTEKAAVFSLGLVLWELETGLVPFGEIDAGNAQRQLAAGTPPKMEHVSDEMRDVISQCLNVDTILRPTLASLSLTLDPADSPEAPEAAEADAMAGGPDRDLRDLLTPLIFLVLGIHFTIHNTGYFTTHQTFSSSFITHQTTLGTSTRLRAFHVVRSASMLDLCSTEQL
ncbi:hypothetical protein BLNAU_6783 [Blattamonas nauphoetae]|uniref:Protein kinase domain-containing protein n=1 Tax=Blattamonas nauphoetae TaxID=2049346 RepID=A0ABQ9Y3I6_9EUKA|nr:hypothetical protein BLNAU_6783 [Blattamonas nauphoetae]